MILQKLVPEGPINNIPTLHDGEKSCSEYIMYRT